MELVLKENNERSLKVATKELLVISKLSDSHFNKDSDTSSLSKTLRAI